MIPLNITNKRNIYMVINSHACFAQAKRKKERKKNKSKLSLMKQNKRAENE